MVHIEYLFRYVSLFLAKNENVSMLNNGGSYAAGLFYSNAFLDFSRNVYRLPLERPTFGVKSDV
jgi:hypothetical protein